MTMLHPTSPMQRNTVGAYDTLGWQRLNEIRMTENATTCRYTETGDQCTFQSWRSGPAGESLTCLLNERPEWLVHIVNAAKLGRYGMSLSRGSSPPDFIVWFDVDDRYNLLRFVEVK